MAVQSEAENLGNSESPEAEVTPAMVAAGRDVIESCWVEFTGVSGPHLWDRVLRGVWQAMSAARR